VTNDLQISFEILIFLGFVVHLSRKLQDCPLECVAAEVSWGVGSSQQVCQRDPGFALVYTIQSPLYCISRLRALTPL
jgi:hypothetical protein